jgi:sulfur-oxidizing protein SoxZ
VAQDMRIRAVMKDGEVLVRAVIRHEMESGQRKDKAGNTIPAHYIQEVRATWQGKVVLGAHWGGGVSKDPFLEFSFKGGKKGDTLQLSWADNLGEKGAAEAVIE